MMTETNQAKTIPEAELWYSVCRNCSGQIFKVVVVKGEPFNRIVALDCVTCHHRETAIPPTVN